eukprot:4872628-Pyramimonas_sp.AAC.1
MSHAFPGSSDPLLRILGALASAPRSDITPRRRGPSAPSRTNCTGVPTRRRGRRKMRGMKRLGRLRRNTKMRRMRKRRRREGRNGSEENEEEKGRPRASLLRPIYSARSSPFVCVASSSYGGPPCLPTPWSLSYPSSYPCHRRRPHRFPHCDPRRVLLLSSALSHRHRPFIVVCCCCSSSSFSPPSP